MKRTMALMILLLSVANLFAIQISDRVTFVLDYSANKGEAEYFQSVTNNFITNADWALGDVKVVYPSATALADSIRLANGKYQEAVFVVLTHGVIRDSLSGIVLADGILWEEDFRQIINTSNGTKIVLIGACYGGGMIDGFMSQTIAFAFVSGNSRAHSDYFIYLGNNIATYRWWYSATWRDMFDGFYFKDMYGQESRGFLNDNGDNTISPISLLTNSIGEDGCFSATINLITAKKNSTTVLFLKSISPDKFSLAQNYPNPFNPTTTIRYELGSTTHVHLTIFNSLGQEVERVVDEFQTPGSHQVIWNAVDAPSGIYYYHLVGEGISEIRRMTLLK